MMDVVGEEEQQQSGQGRRGEEERYGEGGGEFVGGEKEHVQLH